MGALLLRSLDVRVYLDISPYWQKDENGMPRSVNSVYEEIRDKPYAVGRNTLRLALDGKLDRGYFANMVKLAHLCSEWTGQKVDVKDLLRVEE